MTQTNSVNVVAYFNANFNGHGPYAIFFADIGSLGTIIGYGSFFRATVSLDPNCVDGIYSNNNTVVGGTWNDTASNITNMLSLAAAGTVTVEMGAC